MATRGPEGGLTEVPDVRLLVPALTAWALVALSLGRGRLVPFCGAAMLSVGAAALSWRRRATRHPPSDSLRGGPARTRRMRGTVGSWVVLSCLLGAASLTLVGAEEMRATRGPIRDLARQRAVVRIDGVVLDDPRPLRTTEPGTPARTVLTVQVHAVEARGMRSTVATPVLVMAGADAARLRWRDHVTLAGRLDDAGPGQRVRARLMARGDVDVPERDGPGGLSDSVRSAMRAAAEGLPEDPRGLVPAMTVGDRGLVPDDLSDAMRRTGMSHLTAVSGTNCSILLGAVMWCAGHLHVPRRGRPLVGGVAIAVFVVIVHPDPSVLRAAVMGAIGLLGLSTSRRASGMPALAGAVFVLLAVDPWLARSYGFALSVLATLGLLVFARPWADAIKARVPRLGMLAEAVAIPVAASVVCAPVVVLLAGEVALIGVPANALAAPLVVPVTLAGSAAAVTAPMLPWVARACVWIACLPAWGVAIIARRAAEVPLAIPWSDSGWGAIGLAVLLLAGVLFSGRLVRGIRTRPWVTAAAVALVVAVLSARFLLRTSPLDGIATPAVVMCDVGQGDAIVLLTRPGAGILVDTGPDPDSVDDCLDTLRITTVEALVLTHFDLDHVGGLDGVDRGRTVGTVLTSAAALHDVPGPSRRWLGDREVRGLRTGDAVDLDGTHLLTRSPATDRADSANAGSLVLDATITAADRERSLRVLLLADADRATGAAVRTDLAAHPDAGGPVDIVKVAHHGSADHDRALLVDVGAPVALVSVGAGNRYGHPTQSALASLQQAGSYVYRSDQDGTVAVWKEGGRLTAARGRRH